MRDFQQLTKVAGEQSNTAMTAARALGLKITETQAKGESTADLQVSFEKAKTDAVAAIQAVNDLRAEEKLELHAAESQRAQEEHDREMSSLRGARPARAIDTGSPTPRTRRRPALGPMRRRTGVPGGIERMARRLEERASRMTPQQRQGTSEALRGYIKGDLEGMRLAIGAYAERERITPGELHALMTGNETLGGALVRDDQLAEVIRDLPGIAVFAKYARVQPTSRDALSFPSIAAKSAGETSYPSGLPAASKSRRPRPAARRRMFSISRRSSGTVCRCTTGGRTPSRSSSICSRTPMPTWRHAQRDHRADDGAGHGRQVHARPGNTEPLGLLTEHTDFALPTVHSGHASQLTYAGLTKLFAGLPAQYRQGAVWMMNTAGAFAAILQLQTSNGRPILEPNMLPGTLWGKPIAFNERMANPAANAYPIVFGDFRYYIIAMRAQLRVQRLLERFTPNIGLQPWSRFGGQTLRPNAFRRQKCAA